LTVIYRITATSRPGDAEAGGLLGTYQIAYQFTVGPPTDGVPPDDWKSLSGVEQGYKRGPGEPDWAPAAVALHRGFHQLASELLHTLGLEAPAPPEVRFEDLMCP